MVELGIAISAWNRHVSDLIAYLPGAARIGRVRKFYFLMGRHFLIFFCEYCGAK